MKSTNYLILIFVILTSSCGPVMFTQNMRNRVQSTSDDNIEHVQFYNSRDIRITYSTTSTKEKVVGGKVKFRDGKYHYTVSFPKKTRAMAKHLNDDKLKVFFEQGDDRYLIFGRSGEFYTLNGQNKSDGFYVNFEGKSFEVAEGSDVKLKIKKNAKMKVKSDSRKVKGVKVR